MTKEKYQKLLMSKKLTLLELAKELRNISKACQIMGYSRQHYYNVRERFRKEGKTGLSEKSRAPRRVPSRPSLALEKEVIQFVLLNPAYSYIRVADSLRCEKGIYITEHKVRGIFKRFGLTTFKDRLTYLQEEYKKHGFKLTKEQIELLSRVSDTIQSRHIYAPHAGYLLSQDTFYVGYLKGVGRIYMQTVIDCSNSFGFARLYTEKDAITAAHILQNMVIPYYNSLNIPINAILTDNGTEYCGKEDHPYEAMLWLFNIKHRRTKIKSPYTNGFVERFHKTILNEFFKVAFRTNYYHSLEALQNDLDEYLLKYNFKRAHRGYRTKGLTPAITMLKNMKPLALPCAA